ncbi:MAG: hypothetical protein M3141_06640, partial [Actinomycetota bacterium]|nr:hypothetical protein [Actinomycetota bacterium]
MPVPAFLRDRVLRFRYRYGFLGPSGVRARHSEKSLICSADDEARPSPRLLEVGLAAASAARDVSLADLSERMDGPPFWPEVWPGEHYRLLAGLVREVPARTVVE